MKNHCVMRAAAYCAIVAGGVTAAAAAFAAGEATVIAQRQGIMTGQNDHAKAIVNYIKQGEGTPADVAKHAGSISVTARIIPTLFPQGTGMDEVKEPETRAMPEIWLNWEGFEKAAKVLGEEALKLIEVAAGGDKEAIAAQFGAMGKNGCGGCHRDFRAKKD